MVARVGVPLLVVFSLLGCAEAQKTQQPQFDFGRYQPHTIQSIINDHAYAAEETERPGDPAPKSLMAITVKDFAYRVTATYLGEQRELQPDSKALLDGFAKSLGAENFVKSFQHEIRVKEGSTDYWLPAQEVLLPYLREEVRAGDLFDLYLLWIGYIREENKTEGRWIFTVNEFQAKD